MGHLTPQSYYVANAIPDQSAKECTPSDLISCSVGADGLRQSRILIFEARRRHVLFPPFDPSMSFRWCTFGTVRLLLSLPRFSIDSDPATTSRKPRNII